MQKHQAGKKQKQTLHVRWYAKKAKNQGSGSERDPVKR